MKERESIEATGNMEQETNPTPTTSSSWRSRLAGMTWGATSKKNKPLSEVSWFLNSLIHMLSLEFIFLILPLAYSCLCT